MYINIDCIYNDRGAWCTNKNIKRSLFWIGARYCKEYDCKKCELKVKPERPKVIPTPPVKP